jgi:hypothetical protein
MNTATQSVSIYVDNDWPGASIAIREDGAVAFLIGRYEDNPNGLALALATAQFTQQKFNESRIGAYYYRADISKVPATVDVMTDGIDAVIAAFQEAQKRMPSYLQAVAKASLILSRADETRQQMQLAIDSPGLPPGLKLLMQVMQLHHNVNVDAMTSLLSTGKDVATQLEAIVLGDPAAARTGVMRLLETMGVPINLAAGQPGQAPGSERVN